MAILVQRGKGNKDYQEVGPDYPLQVEVRQPPGADVIITYRPRPKPLDYGSYTITGTAGSLLSFADAGSPSAPSAVPSGVKSFRGVLETANIRVRMDGTAATAAEGQLVEVSAVITLSIEEMSIPKAFITAGGVNGVLKGHFYDVEVSALAGGA